MSLLTENDFLLRAFQLSYIRQVLPSHAPNSSRSGQGPYNLIKFDSPDSAPPSPYISLSGLSDETQWPELTSGRSSPPLALTLARDSSRTSHHQARRNDSSEVMTGGRNRRRRTGGPGPLGYTQTIVGKGSGVGGAGMRVDGVKRSWKGKEKMLDDDQGMSLSNAAPGHLAPNLVPPPVVVHSPVRTPRDSPANAYRPTQSHDPPSSMLTELQRTEDPNATVTALRKPRFSTSANEYHSYPSFDSSQPQRHPPSSPVLVESPSTSLVEVPEDGDYPSQPNSQVTDTSSSGFQLGGVSAPASPASVLPTRSLDPSPSPDPPQQDGESPLPEAGSPSRPTRLYRPRSNADRIAPIDEDLVSSDFPSGPLLDQATKDTAAEEIMPVSMASSGISLFGTSRLERSTELNRSSPGGEDSSDQSEVEKRRNRIEGLRGRGRTDSDSSIPLARPTPLAEKEEPKVETSNVPVFKLPPGMRVRERRRVNIKPGLGGALFVPNPPVELGSDAGTKNVEVNKQRSPSQPGGEPVPTTQPSNDKLDTATSSPKRPPLSSSQSRKVSAPMNLTTTDAEKLAPPSPGSRSPRKKDDSPSSILSFPKRSSYIQLGPPSPLLSPPSHQPTKSALTALLTSPSSSSLSSSNPFSTLYAACVSRSSSPSEKLLLTLFFPHCSNPGPSNPINISVKRDVTVEEVIGIGLWAYWEEQEKEERAPKLEVEEERAETGEETTRWNLRIVEEDGEVDEDFPALDRVRNISAFSFTEFAIVKATDQQVQDNITKQSQLTRRPSRILTGPKRVVSAPIPISSSSLAPPPTRDPSRNELGPPQTTGNANGSSFNPQSSAAGEPLGASSSLAVSVSLKVELPSVGFGAERNTTIEVPSDMYLLDVLELICRQRNLGTSNDWAFIVRLSDGEIVVPLDRTVKSLGDQRELVLVSRSQVGTVGLRRQRRNTENIDPSASIFTQVAEEPMTPRYQSASSQLTSTYQLYRVQRKLPMSLGGRHPRSIAIDGDYLHFMPSDGKDSAGRTSSFHISLVQSCKVSRRSASSFKIVVQAKNRVDKRYDFEAENPGQANEIVEAIKTVMSNWKAEQALSRRVIVDR
ncbi:Avo1p [Sporobolomyces salmoneus]|uniref:Avo1p n=1 Tax=Sporobolomyces salmoneus TaxID=183962 RepID=UPI003182AEA1